MNKNCSICLDYIGEEGTYCKICSCYLCDNKKCAEYTDTGIDEELETDEDVDNYTYNTFKCKNCCVENKLNEKLKMSIEKNKKLIVKNEELIEKNEELIEKNEELIEKKRKINGKK